MKFFSSESVTEGHPDKMCDQISDALLDAFLAGDKGSRCAIESLSAGNMIHVAGEVTSATDVDVEKVVRDLVRSIGYTDQSFGIDADGFDWHLSLGKQSPISLRASTRRWSPGMDPPSIPTTRWVLATRESCLATPPMRPSPSCRFPCGSPTGWRSN